MYVCVTSYFTLLEQFFLCFNRDKTKESSRMLAIFSCCFLLLALRANENVEISQQKILTKTMNIPVDTYAKTYMKNYVFILFVCC